MGKTYRHICISSIPCDYVLSLPHTKSDAAPNGADRVFWRGGYKDFAPTELVHGPYRIGAEDRLTIFNRPVRFCVREILRGGHPGLKPWAVMYSRFRLRPIAPF
jgi:hypothetical protein